MRQRLLMFAAFVAAAPALAQDRPLILPIRDVAVMYHSSGMVAGPAGDLANTVMVRFSSNHGRLRVDGPYGRFYAIIDIDAGRMFVVMPEQRLFAEQPADPAIMGLLQPGNAAFRRIGSYTVAGLPCTEFDAAVNDRTGRVCLTEDGVLLQARLSARDRRLELDAIKVTYAYQPDTWFEIPAGYRHLNIPQMPYGLDFGVPGGGPRSGYQGSPSGR